MEPISATALLITLFSNKDVQDAAIGLGSDAIQWARGWFKKRDPKVAEMLEHQPTEKGTALAVENLMDEIRKDPDLMQELAAKLEPAVAEGQELKMGKAYLEFTDNIINYGDNVKIVKIKRVEGNVSL